MGKSSLTNDTNDRISVGTSHWVIILLAEFLIGAGVAWLGWASVIWFVLFLLLLVLFLIARRAILHKMDIFSPTILFGGVYTLYYAIGMLPNKALGWYTEPIAPSVILWGALGLLCFGGGILFAYAIVGRIRSSFGMLLQTQLIDSIDQLSKVRTKGVLCLYGIIGGMFALAEFGLGGGVPILLRRGEAGNLLRYDIIRQAGYFVHFQIYFMYIAMILASAIALRRRWAKPMATVLIFANLFFFLSTYNRVEVIRVLFSLVILFHYLRKPVGLRFSALLALGVLLAVGGIHMLRIGISIGNISDSASLIFWYFQGSVGFPVRVFEKVLAEVPSTVNYFRGRFNFSTFLSLFGQYPSGPELIREHLFPERYTAQTLVLPGGWYADGGGGAVIVGMFVMGFLMQLCYILLLRRGTIMWLLIYVNVAFEMLYSIYLGGGALGVRLWLLVLLSFTAYQIAAKRSTAFSWLSGFFTIIAVLAGATKLLLLAF